MQSSSPKKPHLRLVFCVKYCFCFVEMNTFTRIPVFIVGFNVNILLFGLFLFQEFLTVVNTVANNLHTYDGISSSDIIGVDVFFEIVEPEELGYTYRIRPAKDFGAQFNETFSGYGIPLVPVEPPCGCGWPHNAEELEGSVALVERGECSFLSKTVKAEEVGARAIIVANQDPESDEFYIEMINDNTSREVHIPAGFLLGKNGYMIRKTLERMQRKYALINIPVNLTYVPLNKINQPPWLRW